MSTLKVDNIRHNNDSGMVQMTGGVGVGTVTTSGRNAGVSTATGALIYNTTTNSLEVYNGSSWLSVTAKSGSFNISYLVIGGGGAGGGSFRGGGGGAGAYRTNYSTNSQGGGQSTGSAKTVTTGNAYSVVIGAGGAGVNGQNGNNGAQSKFDDITADGGGGGGKYITAANTNSGNGSGGGGGGQLESRGRVVLVVLTDTLVVMDLIVYNVEEVAVELPLAVVAVVKAHKLVMVDLHLRVRSVEHQY